MNISILPTNFEKNSQILFIKHPRTNLSSPFLVTADKIYELMEVDRGNSSFLFAKQVISNGKVFLAIEFHPLFLALPLIMYRKSELYSLEGYFDDTDLKEIELLIKPYFYLVCQQSKVSGYVVWSYNEKMMLDWLCNKVLKLIPYFREKKKNEQNTIIHENDFIESSFDIIKHYVKATLAQILKDELKRRYPGSFQPLSSSQNSIQFSQIKSNSNAINQNLIDYTHESNNIINSKDITPSKPKIKSEQSKKQLKKDTDTKKKKKDIKIPKCSIESFFSPEKKK